MFFYIYIDTHTHTHTQNGMLLSQKEEWIMPFAAKYMDLKIIIKWSKPDRKKNVKCRMTSLICGILKKETNVLITK